MLLSVTEIFALSPEQKSYLQSLGSIRLCTAPESPPLDAIVDGEHTGMNAEYFKIFKSKLPIPVELVLSTTWNESLVMIQNNQCDIISLVAETPQRREYLYFTDTYVQIPFVIVTTQEKFFISKISLLKDKPLGVIKGYAYVDLLRNRYPEINLVEVESRTQGLEYVSSGKLYGFFSGLHLAGYGIQEGGYTNLKINGQFDELSTINLGIGVHHSKKPLVAIFNQLISEVTPEQTKRIDNSWRRVQFDISESYRHITFIIIVCLILLIGFAVIYLQARKHNKILEEKEKEQWHQAHFDFLTNLPNRRLLVERLEQTLKSHQRNQKQFAVILIDLDGFKEVNDSLGHENGDKLLVEASKRLKQSLRQSDTIARIGGDEFVALLTHIKEDFLIGSVLQKILLAFQEPFIVEKNPVYVSTSIGVTIYPQDLKEGENELTLLKNADQAMYAAKKTGKNNFHFFTQSMHEEALYRLDILTDLRTAIKKDEFEVFYQPIIELPANTVTKAEALIRWRSPKRGLVPPDKFIPTLEESRLINQVGDWVFETASSYLEENSNNSFRISINVSPVQLKTQTLKHWRERIKASPKLEGKLVLEITESLLLEAETAKDLKKMRDAGFKIAVDDFGVGYSSLSYLRNFPIDYLKIDRSFINDLTPNSNEYYLCQAIVAMAHQLNIEVIAEGVETLEQQNLLKSLNCNFIQGYLHAKPMPVDEFNAFIKNQG
ncbi:EAL domain-containing protein [Pleionea sediminis]|uniref:EAL domain-containing protein n=1 Tax=Pleionea sediminis TaxID=2569479 RepID=UPI0011854756|nr:EAL domain-containing protein [Pleionea sediminis]